MANLLQSSWQTQGCRDGVVGDAWIQENLKSLGSLSSLSEGRGDSAVGAGADQPGKQHRAGQAARCVDAMEEDDEEEEEDDEEEYAVDDDDDDDDEQDDDDDDDDEDDGEDDDDDEDVASEECHAEEEEKAVSTGSAAVRQSAGPLACVSESPSKQQSSGPCAASSSQGDVASHLAALDYLSAQQQMYQPAMCPGPSVADAEYMQLCRAAGIPLFASPDAYQQTAEIERLGNMAGAYLPNGHLQLGFAGQQHQHQHQHQHQQLQHRQHQQHQQPVPQHGFQQELLPYAHHDHRRAF
ncbi:hypothetical protein LPJ75_006020 [Coemansia sp. RSA 2598]|nr:hypothetical protein LPJ75_006020 [Coemansia sp. RSA 2598]